ncbi:hypothetical protein DFH11DRAFT_1621035 [Phellopilus nigrolimitatus]|nr:hypothetical protein DFH11DRAFT_1621035 [Phellopilus nigrolimitatus]
MSMRSLPTEIVDMVAKLLFPQRLGDAKETLVLYLRYFTRADLLHLISFAATCRAFRDICLPHIYSCACLSSPGHVDGFEQRMRELSLQSHNVKHMTIRPPLDSGKLNPDVLNDLCRFTGVTTLFLDDVPLSQATINALTHLRGLTMLAVSIWDHMEEEDSIADDAAFKDMPALRKLQLKLNLSGSEAVVAFIPLIRAVRGSLEELSITGSGLNHEREWNFVAALKLGTMFFPNLKALKTFFLPIFPSALRDFVELHRGTIKYLDDTRGDAPGNSSMGWLSLICSSIIGKKGTATEGKPGEGTRQHANLEKWKQVVFKDFAIGFEDACSSPGGCPSNGKVTRVLTDLRINFTEVDNDIQVLGRENRAMFAQPIFRSLKFLSLAVPFDSKYRVSHSLVRPLFRTVFQFFMKLTDKRFLLIWNKQNALNRTCKKHMPELQSLVLKKDTTDRIEEILWQLPEAPKPGEDENRCAFETPCSPYEISDDRELRDAVSAFLGANASVERFEWRFAHWHHYDKVIGSWVWTRDPHANVVASEAGKPVPVIGKLSHSHMGSVYYGRV